MNTNLPIEQLPSTLALIRAALDEDLGGIGDVTSMALVPPDRPAAALVVARHPMALAGLDVAAKVFRTVDPFISVRHLAADGDGLSAPAPVLRVEGPARSLLTAERTALNFLQRMCGIATATRRLVDLVAPSPVRILDTRKTLPAYRALDKYSVACGGGTNHRMGLFDAVLIKDNHLAFWRENARGSLADAVRAAREACPGLKIELEVDTLDQLREALPARPDWVLLDNMPPPLLREAVALCRGVCLTEASGGITAETLPAAAATGVTAVSLGALTHSVKAADLALDFL